MQYKNAKIKKIFANWLTTFCAHAIICTVTKRLTKGDDIMAKVRELRGLIYSNFDSESQFANAIGWPRQRVSKITNGTKEPNIDELNTFAGALHKSVGEMAQIFLRYESPNEQHNKQETT